WIGSGVERDLIRTRTSEGRERAKTRGVKLGSQAEAHFAAEGRGSRASGSRRNTHGYRSHLQRQFRHHFQAQAMSESRHLRRIDPDRNITWLASTLSVQLTLFGDWALSREWGRIGTRRVS